MRHSVYGYKLNKNIDERGRLFTSLITSLLSYGYLETSHTKAKAIKGLVDKIINLAKDKNRQRLIPSFITNKNLRDRLIKEIVPKMENRTSGYTSLVKLGTRYGDQTMMVRLSLIGVGEMGPIKKELRIKNEELSKKIKEPSKLSEKKEIKKSISEKKVRTERSVRKTVSARRGTSRLSKVK